MTQERAVLAGGCFWGVQELFRAMTGVLATAVGYTGGDLPNATYRNHGTHAEAVEIEFDPARTHLSPDPGILLPASRSDDAESPGQRLRHFYRSAIFYTSDEQRGRPRTTPRGWMRQRCGPARSSPKSCPRAISGKPSPNTRTLPAEEPRRLHLPLHHRRGGSCRFARARARSPEASLSGDCQQDFRDDRCSGRKAHHAGDHARRYFVRAEDLASNSDAPSATLA